MQTQVRDHGVFTAPPPATIETAKLSHTQLLAQKAEVDARLAPLLEKIKSGEASAAEIASVSELGEEARRVAGQLHQAQVQLTVAQEVQEKRDATTRRERFNQLIVEARQKRSEFARLYRDACIALGRLCANVDEAVALANRFAAGGVAGMDPIVRNKVAEMSERIDPLAALLDSGLSPTTGFGWDFRIAVVPLKGK